MDTTYKEIHDTFHALERTASYLDERWGEIETFLKGKSRFVFLGAGSSYSLAKSFSTMCCMGTGKPSYALAAGDVLLHAQRYKKVFDGATVVFVSRSGRTSELLMALDALKSQGCNISAVASMVCDDEAPLGEKSDPTLSTPWAFDESVCQTRTVSNFYFMAAYIAARIADDQAAVHELRDMLAAGPAFLMKMETLAQEISARSWTHAVVLADAELEGIAEEGALVFKEVCQLPSNYYHVLDVRHGPMVLIGVDALVIAAVGASNELEHKLLQDIQEKGALTLAFSDVEAELPGVLCASFGHSLSHVAKGVPLIILCQMIAYYKSKLTGADPDQPTGLDSWIAL